MLERVHQHIPAEVELGVADGGGHCIQVKVGGRLTGRIQLQYRIITEIVESPQAKGLIDPGRGLCLAQPLVEGEAVQGGEWREHLAEGGQERHLQRQPRAAVDAAEGDQTAFAGVDCAVAVGVKTAVIDAQVVVGVVAADCVRLVGIDREVAIAVPEYGGSQQITVGRRAAAIAAADAEFKERNLGQFFFPHRVPDGVETHVQTHLYFGLQIGGQAPHQFK